MRKELMQNAVNLKYSLTDSEKWGAVAACDKSYDGMFFYGVKTTGIFCRPFCTAKKPLRETDMNILQIALGCGFESPSNFYKRFKEHTGVTPAQYRSIGGTRQ
jgi:methylphosphotriester-DNA--protein-cysteine methyltransferase